VDEKNLKDQLSHLRAVSAEIDLLAEWSNRVGPYNCLVLLPFLIRYLEDMKIIVDPGGDQVTVLTIIKSLQRLYKKFVSHTMTREDNLGISEEERLAFKRVLLANVNILFSPTYLRDLQGDVIDQVMFDAGFSREFLKVVNGEFENTGGKLDYDPDIVDVYSNEKNISEIAESLVICLESLGMLGELKKPNQELDVLEIIRKNRKPLKSIIGGGSD
jgi:hypothetical protein